MRAVAQLDSPLAHLFFKRFSRVFFFFFALLFLFFLINCVHAKVVFASQMGCVFDSGWDCATTTAGLAAFRWLRRRLSSGGQPPVGG